MSRTLLLAGSLLVAGSALVACADMQLAGADDRGRDECRREARDRGFDVGRISQSDSGNRLVTYSVELERNDRNYTGLCLYNTDRRTAELDVRRASGSGFFGSGTSVEARAREACRDKAEAKGFDVRDIDTGDVGNRRVRLALDLRRDNRDFRGRCTFDADSGDVDLDTDRG